MIAALTPDPIAAAPTAPAGPRVRLLGKVEIQNATGKRPQAPGRSTEIIAFLALHPNSSTEQLDKAITFLTFEPSLLSRILSLLPIRLLPLRTGFLTPCTCLSL